ncbi:MAG: hypothetical protein J6Y37_00025 [Paludibacteraceae bacterium]|nr:hypothetical protein [Paludibacteraceae bacterium]
MKHTFIILFCWLIGCSVVAQNEEKQGNALEKRAEVTLQKKDDVFYRLLEKGSADVLEKAQYYMDPWILNDYDMNYIDCQFFLFMFEYAYQYNDGVAFQYLTNFISSIYEKFELTPDSLALDVMHRFSDRAQKDPRLPNDSLASELKHKLDKQQEDKTNSTEPYFIYRVICETFSTEHADHEKTSKLYHTLYNDMKNQRGRGTRIGQLFFLSLIIADQSKDPLAYACLYDQVCGFYLSNGLKISDPIFEIISSWLTHLHSDNKQVLYRISRLEKYKEMILQNRSACE